MQTFTAEEYLMIDIANNMGHDKINWDERLAWFKTNEHQLEALQGYAKAPALYYAGVKAYRDHKQGKPIGYPISLDATASGIQLLSIKSACAKSASTCNVINTGKRKDVYRDIWKRMQERVGETLNLDYDKVKKACMTAFYGSKAAPKRAFGEGELLDIFYETVAEMLPGAWALNVAYLDSWQTNVLDHSWVMPDNFHVICKVENREVKGFMFDGGFNTVTHVVNAPSKYGKANAANASHSVDAMIVRELANRCALEPERKEALYASLDHTGKSMKRDQDILVITLWNHYLDSGFLSSRILNYLDSFNMGHVNKTMINTLLDTLPKKSFKMLTTHDSFRVHPNYGNDIRRQYNQVLYELAKSNILQFLFRQLMRDMTITVNKADDFADQILEADYALS